MSDAFGPLAGLRVLEVGGLGPGPFAGMVLSDMGAEVLRVTRPNEADLGGTQRALLRGRITVEVDLKEPAGVATVRALAGEADVLIEGYRPGVMERLGLGPDLLLDDNPRLVYGRITGYGQDGPLAQMAGHDINYIALSGVLHSIRRAGQGPVPPLNLVADFGGGGMLLAFGVLCALQHASRTGAGQVVDAGMVDGSSLLMTMIHGLVAEGAWNDRPGTNGLDTGAPFYDVYETADGGHMAVGAVEPFFYVEFVRRLGFTPEDFPQWERDRWPEFRERFAGVFRTRTRAEWTKEFEEVEACVTPVLSLAEAPAHPHNRARDAFAELDGALVPSPAPRLSQTPARFGQGRSMTAADACARWVRPHRSID